MTTPSSPQQTAGAQAQPVATTEYVILKLNEDGAYEKVGQRSARDASAAIKALVQALDDDDQAGTFVAVPVRSWQPVRVRPVVTTTLEIEEATS